MNDDDDIDEEDDSELEDGLRAAFEAGRQRGRAAGWSDAVEQLRLIAGNPEAVLKAMDPADDELRSVNDLYAEDVGAGRKPRPYAPRGGPSASMPEPPRALLTENDEYLDQFDELSGVSAEELLHAVRIATEQACSGELPGDELSDEEPDAGVESLLIELARSPGDLTPEVARVLLPELRRGSRAAIVALRTSLTEREGRGSGEDVEPSAHWRPAADAVKRFASSDIVRAKLAARHVADTARKGQIPDLARAAAQFGGLDPRITKSFCAGSLCCCEFGVACFAEILDSAGDVDESVWAGWLATLDFTRPDLIDLACEQIETLQSERNYSDD